MVAASFSTPTWQTMPSASGRIICRSSGWAICHTSTSMPSIRRGNRKGKKPTVETMSTICTVAPAAMSLSLSCVSLISSGAPAAQANRISAAEYGAPMPAMMMNNSITPGTTKKLATTMRVRNCQSRRCLAMRAGCWVRPTLNMLVSTKSVVSVLAKDWKNSNMG